MSLLNTLLNLVGLGRPVQPPTTVYIKSIRQRSRPSVIRHGSKTYYQAADSEYRSADGDMLPYYWCLWYLADTTQERNQLIEEHPEIAHSISQEDSMPISPLPAEDPSTTHGPFQYPEASEPSHPSQDVDNSSSFSGDGTSSSFDSGGDSGGGGGGGGVD